MTPRSALRAISLPPALMVSMMAHAGLIAAILGMEDAPPAPPRPGGVITVEIVVDGPKSQPGPAPIRPAAPPTMAAAPGQAVQGTQDRAAAPVPTHAPAVPPRAPRKPLHLAPTGVPLQKPASVNHIAAPAPPAVQPHGGDRPDGLIRATLTPAAHRSAGDRGASPRGDNPKPAYPFVARRRGQEGQVFLNVEVLPDGTAGRVALARSSGFRSLDDAARRAVTRWRFLPARQGGAPVAAMVTVPVRFSLQ